MFLPTGQTKTLLPLVYKPTHFITKACCVKNLKIYVAKFTMYYYIVKVDISHLLQHLVSF